MRFAVLFTVLSLILTMPVASHAADQSKQAKAFVENVATQAFDTIKAKRAGKLTETKAKTNFRTILTAAFDVPTIARFTLGRYWRVATPAEQKEYTQLIKTVILEKYADRVLGYSGDGFEVKESKAINEKDYMVSMDIDRANAAPVAFGWRLRQDGKTFKVIDISVEGISMSVTHRSDFASVIESNGGSIKALIDALKNKELPDSDK